MSVSARTEEKAKRAYVLGAGLAGLSAALRLCDAGYRVSVFEASPHLGGRCRSYEDPELGLLDNGTHALTAANPVALGLLARMGVRGRWRPSADGPLRMVDLDERRVLTLRPRLSDFASLGLRPKHLLRLLGPDRPIARLISPEDAVYRRLIEPLTVAALNTAPTEASSRLLRRLFLETWRGPSALIPLVAENGVGPDLVAPLGNEIRRRGGRITTGMRVKRLQFRGGGVAAFEAGAEIVTVGAAAPVIIALPPAETERLTGLSFGFGYSPIVNAHFDMGAKLTPGTCMIGVLGGSAQWVLLRDRIASVTVSAADAFVDAQADGLAARLWADVKATLELCGYAPPQNARAHRIVKERRATIRQTPRLKRPRAATSWSNVFLAGDFTRTGLPATIEGALRSGIRAAETAIRHVSR